MSRRSLSISRDILDDERIAALSDESWRRFMSIWTLADGQGNLSLTRAVSDHPVWRKYVPDSHEQMEPDAGDFPQVREMIVSGVLVPYAKDGGVYLHISAWDPRLSKRRPSGARVPNQADADESLPDWFRQLMGSR